MSTILGKQVLRIADVSSELLSIFSRRRELLIQTAIIITAASLLDKLLASDTLTQHWNVNAATAVSWFVAGATVVFCLRFIQLHAGLVINAMRFTVIEHYHMGGDLKAMLTQTGHLNVRGMSAQIIIYLAILSGLTVGTATAQQGASGRLAATIGITVGLILLIRAATAHWFVVRIVHDEGHLSHSTIQSSSGELRQHYLASLATAHSEMIAISALLASLTFTTLNLTSQRLTHERIPIDWVRIMLLCGFSIVLSYIALRIYERLRKGIVNFCTILDVSYSRMFPFSLSDSTLGFMVLAFFTTLNIATPIMLCFHWSGVTVSYPWLLVCAVLLNIALVMWHHRVIMLLKQRAAAIGPHDPMIWADNSHSRQRPS